MTTVTVGNDISRRERYQRVFGALKTERASFEATWGELADHYSPRRIRRTLSDRNRGDRRDSLIYDSNPRFALRTLQSGLHAGITSPARPWFKLATPDPDLAEQGDVKQWLHTLTNRLHTVFLRSNLYNALPILYGDLGAFGTAAMSLLEDPEDVMRAYCYPIQSYAFGLDDRGVATTFARDYRRTVRQLVSEFGGQNGQPLEPGQPVQWRNFSQAVRAAYDKGDYETAVDIVWFVCPNEDYRPNALSAKYRYRWKSCWFEQGQQYQALEGGDGFLRESGYRTFPFLCPRWDVVAEDTYGTDAPGWIALGDVKQLQYMARKTAKAIGKAVDPPMKAPMSLRNQKVSLIEGDLTYVDERDANKSLAPVHEVSLQGLQFLLQDRNETRYRVNQAFYADLFLMLANSNYLQNGGTPVTAREIEERHEEKLLALGPVLERLNDELLDPLIDRAFDILDTFGAVPPPPPALEGVDLKVEYVSIMAQAQKLVGVVGQDRFVTTIAGLATQLAPVAPGAAQELTEKVDWMQVADDYGDQLGINPKAIRSDDAVQERIAAGQQAAAAAQEAETLKTAAQAGQALAGTPTQGGSSNALSDVLGGAI